jgi:predicted alpha/beta-hydrolase family hydrolase
MKSSPKLFERPGVRGWLHAPSGDPRCAMALTHGAGGNCDSPLIVAVAAAFAEDGYLVLRYDLPFRQQRRSGGPSGNGARDREGIQLAADALLGVAKGVPVCLAGHSYGGRQSTMVAAEDASVASKLLLLSYPLHPPGQPARKRVEHFPALRVPALFVHGTRDPFGSIDEMQEAVKLIPAPVRLVPVDGGGHGLPPPIARALPGWFETIAVRDHS